MDVKEKRKKRYRRHRRVRGKVFGTAERPRLCVFRSNKHIYAQLIDDEKARTLASANDLKNKLKTQKKKIKIKGKKQGEEVKEIEMTRKLASAYEVGKLIAEKAKELKIEKVVFDRAGYKYHGRVKALAEGARAGGLKF